MQIFFPMKKWSTALLIVAAALASCDKDDDNSSSGGNNAPDPIAGLVVKNQSNVLLVENTGAWCQYCPNGAEIMLNLAANYDFIVPVALHNNDGLMNPSSVIWDSIFVQDGFPTIHVNGEALANYNDAEATALLASTDPAVLGVAHNVEDADTSWLVHVKAEFFQDAIQKNYFLQSFLILENVLAKDNSAVGGTDLRQVSSVQWVDKGPTGGSSIWNVDAGFVDTTPTVRAGDDFYHKDNLWAFAEGDSNMTQWGLPLAAVNPFGSDYAAGDVIGSKYTPIRFHIDKPSDLAGLNVVGYKVLTVVWELVLDGGNYVYRYTNAYESSIPE